MVNVKSKRCEFPDCASITPVFNEEGATTGRFCVKHKEPGMVDVKHKRCEFTDCGSINPVFNEEGETPGRFCAKHKEPGMVNVMCKRCEVPDCGSINPVFNEEGATTGRYCAKHKEPGMVDVKTKRCEFPDCRTGAGFGVPGCNATHCFEHIQQGQISNPKHRCTLGKCKEIATHGYTSARYCENHAPKDTFDLVQRQCVKCELVWILDEDGYCWTCRPNLYQRIRLAKQREVRNYFNFNKMKYDSYDRIIDGGDCGKERPDFVFDFESKIVIVEVDEFQHQERACDCEQTRMVNICSSYLGVPVVFVRWNPDPFKMNGKTEVVPLSKRLQVLEGWIRHFQKPETFVTNLLSVLYLYFDDWDNNVEVILRYDGAASSSSE
jgi:hypothetical protein